MKEMHSKSSARKQSKWTYAVVAIAAVALLAMAWTAYKNPTLFRALMSTSAPGPGGGDAAVCGDGVKAGSEACDDGNKLAGDGCSSSCSIVAGWTCAGTPSVCQKCGNGTREGSEVCDDGNSTTETSCAYGVASCTKCNATCSASLALTGGQCGDGTKDAPEACDDGNLINETACASGTATCEKCDSTCHVLYLTGAIDDGSVMTLSGPATMIVGQPQRYKISLVVPNGGDGWRGLNCLSHISFHKGNVAATVAVDAELSPDNSLGVSYTPTATGTSTLYVDCPEYIRPSNSMLVTVNPVPAPVCGNSAVETGETCDDGNTVTETCPTYNVACTVCNSQCQSGPGVKLFCGDLIKNGTEECDGSVPAGKSCATEVGQGSTGALSCSSGATGCAIVKTACSAAACVPAACFTDADASKVDDYLSGNYTLQAGELAKFDTNCNGTVTDGDAGYISDHICP
ncbi:DUF4215 domain-containing protein [Candidatus Peregrinibacteria bacterium]|nr:DUF4215 domain-containing protein [Candidatus Peregrinibacteria bacterium]